MAVDYFSREKNLQRLRKEEFDVLVIGGGITGAGIARDAALRGLSVAVVESRDFASGTSSKSSKLLHGGIRYLEQFHFALVFEASRERRLHKDFLAPHLAQSVPFMIPIYPWSPHGLAAATVGVYLYEALALFRNSGTRSLRTETTVQEEPRLESNGLRGSVVYHDVVMDDARITLENARSAALHGACVVNYVIVRGFEKDPGGRIHGVWAREHSHTAGHTDEHDFLIKAKMVVNATGPWSDYVRRLDHPDAPPMLRPTKGVHMVLPKEKLGKQHAFVLTAKADSRVFFSIPWFDRTLVGTTDTDYDPRTDGDLYDIHANENEVDYLMEGVRRTFPHADIKPEDVCSTFAGLRPLVVEGAGAAGGVNPSAVSREHLIWRERSGLFTIAGGKYTTYRAMAEQLVNQVVKAYKDEYEGEAGKITNKVTTHLEPLVMNQSQKERTVVRHAIDEIKKTLGDDTVFHLQNRYGARWAYVAEVAMDRADLRARIIPSELDILAEAVYAKENEMAVHLEDFLRRRTMLALKAALVADVSVLKKVADIFGESAPTKETVLKWQGLAYKP